MIYEYVDVATHFHPNVTSEFTSFKPRVFFAGAVASVGSQRASYCQSFVLTLLLWGVVLIPISFVRQSS